MQRYQRRFFDPETFPPQVLALAEEIETIREHRLGELNAEIARAEAVKDGTQVRALRREKRRYLFTAGSGRALGIAGINVGVGVSTFEELYKGKIRHPPSAHLIRQLADHLDCSLQERNRLLVAAGYPRELAPAGPPTLSPEVQRIITERLFRYAYPGVIVNRVWDVLGANARYWRLWDLPDDSLERWPPSRRNALYLIFARDMPIRGRLGTTPKEWDLIARTSTRVFKLHNLDVQHEPWYQDKIKELCALDGELARVWSEVEADTVLAPQAVPADDPKSPTQPIYMVPFNTKGHSKGASSPVVHLVPHLNPMGDQLYPAIFSYEPYDDATRDWFVATGLLPQPFV